MAFYRPEPSQLGERDDGGGLSAEVNHFERLDRIRAPGRLCGHTSTVPDIYPAGRMTRCGITGPGAGVDDALHDQGGAEAHGDEDQRLEGQAEPGSG